MDDQTAEGPEEWTQEQTEALHELAKNYIHSRWFWKRAGWWLAWTMGLPGAMLMVWEPIVKLWKLLRVLFGGVG